MRRDGPAGDNPASDGPAGDSPLRDDEAHLAALMAVLALTPTDATPDGTPLQQWRARRLAALSASLDGRTTPPTRPLPRPAGQSRSF